MPKVDSSNSVPFSWLRQCKVANSSVLSAFFYIKHNLLYLGGVFRRGQRAFHPHSVSSQVMADNRSVQCEHINRGLRLHVADDLLGRYELEFNNSISKMYSVCPALGHPRNNAIQFLILVKNLNGCLTRMFCLNLAWFCLMILLMSAIIWSYLLLSCFSFTASLSCTVFTCVVFPLPCL